MVFDRFREIGNKMMFPIARKLSWVDPDILTMFAFILSMGAAALFYVSRIELLIPAAGLILLSGFFDYLDGSIAKVNKKETKRGDFLDHTMDRFSDIAIFGGIALSGFVNVYAGFTALITILLVSYMGTQSHALTGKRDYSGMLGRADRMIFLAAAAVLQFFFKTYFVLEIFVYILIVIGVITVIQRFVNTWNKLK